MAATSVSVYSPVPQPSELPVPAWKPLPNGRLREVCVRYGRSRIPIDRGCLITDPKDVWNAFKDIALEPVEVFRVVFLDASHRLLAYEDIARGTVSKVSVHPREVFYSAVHLRASAVVCLHNHPSGSIEPSVEDRTVTQRLKEAGRLLGIELLDHIIVGDGGFFSFRESGLV